MTEPDPIGTARNQLRDAIVEFQPPICDTLTISPWVAMSLLQKSVRRRRKGLALQAAATLLHTLSVIRIFETGGMILERRLQLI